MTADTCYERTLPICIIHNLPRPRYYDQRCHLSEILISENLSGGGATPPLLFHRLNVVVRSPHLSREVGRSGDTTTTRGPTIQSSPIVWKTQVGLSGNLELYINVMFVHTCVIIVQNLAFSG